MKIQNVWVWDQTFDPVNNFLKGMIIMIVLHLPTFPIVTFESMDHK